MMRWTPRVPGASAREQTQPGANALRRILGIPPMMKDPPEAEAEYFA
jgi:hypothetical protein